MMKIKFTKLFWKMYQNLKKNQKIKVNKILHQFEQNPHHSLLKNHKLKGSMEGKRAISAGGDLRLIFLEEADYTLVLFLEVGSHNQVY